MGWHMSTFLRCKAGDLVMLVRSKNRTRLGRIGVIVCATDSTAASCVTHPGELAEVRHRDWIVDFEGAPDVSVRDGRVMTTNRMACHDHALIPLRGHGQGQESIVAEAVGGAA